jgi:hypothetical protein
MSGASRSLTRGGPRSSSERVRPELSSARSAQRQRLTTAVEEAKSVDALSSDAHKANEP